MPTDDERREVAARLRNFEQLRDVFRESNVCAFCDVLGVGYMDWEHICARLADLIDSPTCTIVCECDAYSSWGERIDGMRLYELSCGHQAVGFEKPEHCPKCGAAIVVSEED